MQQHASPRFLSARDAARCVGISTHTMYDWINRGYFPSHRFGRTVRILASDFQAFLERTRMNELATGVELGAQEEILGVEMSR
jgi:excisionase family DNA binding protein